MVLVVMMVVEGLSWLLAVESGAKDDCFTSYQAVLTGWVLYEF